MGIKSRSLLQHRFETWLERTNPTKIKLIRAKPFTCDQNTPGSKCFQEGRNSIDELCPICGGTGYLGGNSTDDDKGPIYSWTYRIFGDVQTGHGMYGVGGDFLKLVTDLGKMQVGDATLFCKMVDYDRESGLYVFPKVDKTLPRPDRIISHDGTVYNVLRGLVADKGEEHICRIITLDEGFSIALGSH